MRRKTKIISAISSFIFIIILVGILFFIGVIKINVPSLAQYPIRGVDVSEYQGHIDWDLIEQQGIQFAFIKATEGSGYVDPFFLANWEAVESTKLLVGAYHFFSFDSPAQTQSERFIATVEPKIGMLPPVVDVELYGKHKNNHPNAEVVRAQLNIMLDMLEAQYGAKPIIYATQQSYSLYIDGHYAQYPLWIRDVYFTPSSNVEWTFWQYSDKGKLDGYDGREQYIDMNVYFKDEAELAKLR